MMRSIAITLLVGLFAISTAFAADPEPCDGWDFGGKKFCVYGDIELAIENGDIVITSEHRRYDDEVRITDKYQLFINNEEIKTNGEQSEILKKFHDQAMELSAESKIIAREGARIGIQGAKIGTKAASGVMKMLFLNFDEEEFEREIEKEAEEIETMAEKLEEQAEELEEMADNLEETHDDLSREISELNKLKWF